MQLSEQERSLFQALLSLSNDATLRVAGGWVRDKALGLESDDIDMLVEGLSAEDFAGLVSSGIPGSSKVGIVKANPNAGKPMRTACMRVQGKSLDIANPKGEGAPK